VAATILIAGMSSMLICIFLGPRFIDFLREKEFGQHIREEGPEGHKTKAGTPTMGGLIMFVAVAIPFLILGNYDAASLAVFFTMIASAALGFLDDWIKISKKRSLGVSARHKLLAQALIAIGLSYVAVKYVGLEPVLKLRPWDATIDLNVPVHLGPITFQPAYAAMIFLVLAGASNGVNLTDGLDGLAAGCAAIVLLAYTAMTFITSGQEDLSLLCACLVGAAVGFLWFNSFPAAIFMGDTGSLGLGGAIAALAVMTQTEILLLIIGGIFVIEALSVAIQVFAFQRFRRRVFLMAPVHHHFELMAWSETKIILRFWIAAAICSAIGFTLYQQSIH
jgi:phospho-N-acetylmuramoyl-pentapeptide-transferase